MSADPVAFSADAPLIEAARDMKRADIGDVIVLDDDRVCGVVTDRDIVVRAVAEGRDPGITRLGDVYSRSLVTLAPSDTVEAAIGLMREHVIRRLPIVEGRQAGEDSLAWRSRHRAGQRLRSRQHQRGARERLNTATDSRQ